jgi:putative DNA primase/helicase
VTNGATVDVFDEAGREQDDDSAPPHFRLTGGGNAERLIYLHGRDLRYVHPWKQWLVWDGRRFSPDNTGDLMRRAKDTVLSMYAEVETLTDPARRRAAANHAIKSDSERLMREMINLARAYVPALPHQLDADPWKLTVANKTIDLRSGIALPHSRKDLITKLAPVMFDASATCPQWVTFLENVFRGDKDLVAFVQRAIGYSLTGDTGEQVLFLLHGAGANGKSTLVRTLLALLGDYGQQADFSTFLERRSEGPRNDLARLPGSRLVAAIEAEGNRRLAESLVKQLTGGDAIAARKLFSEFFEFTPQFKLWLAANHKPVIHGTDQAMWRRIRLIPFNVTVPEDRRDPELPQKLRAELPGILRWAIDGCVAWQKERLGVPPAVREATSSYRTEMDDLAGFLEECCEAGQEYRVGAGPLYEAYRTWCGHTGDQPLSQKLFGKTLTERGYHRVKSGTYAWFGLRLSDHWDRWDHSSGNSPMAALVEEG